MLTVHIPALVHSTSAQVVVNSPKAFFKALNQLRRSLLAKVAFAVGVAQVFGLTK
jgi:hypothetical protein